MSIHRVSLYELMRHVCHAADALRRHPVVEDPTHPARDLEWARRLRGFVNVVNPCTSGLYTNLAPVNQQVALRETTDQALKQELEVVEVEVAYRARLPRNRRQEEQP
jgi:hypothetical protein